MATLIKNQFVGGTANECQAGQAPILSQTFCNLTTAIGNDVASEVDL